MKSWQAMYVGRDQSFGTAWRWLKKLEMPAAAMSKRPCVFLVDDDEDVAKFLSSRLCNAKRTVSGGVAIV